MPTYAINYGQTSQYGRISGPSSAMGGQTVSVNITVVSGYEFRRLKVTQQSSGRTTYLAQTIFTMPYGNIYVTAEFGKIRYRITKEIEPAGSGTLTVQTLAEKDETVSIGYEAATGYEISYMELSTGGAITDNSFVMPEQNVTLTAHFIKTTYTITSQTNPTGAGTVTVQGTAEYGDTVSVAQTPGTGYYFNGWAISSGTSVENNSFSMPAENILITANYLKRSTLVIPNNEMKGGTTWAASITSENSSYTHKYEITFPGGITTGLTDVPAGSNTISFTVSSAWASQITNAQRLSGGTITLHTYNGATEIGTFSVSNLVYVIPDGLEPTISACAASVMTTVESFTFADLGCYVQNHSGIRIVPTIQMQSGATLTSARIRIEGYEGEKYDKTITNASTSAQGVSEPVFESGILTSSGALYYIVTATDSRGLSVTQRTGPITVNPYTAPTIQSFDVWRCDGTGTEDPAGAYGKYKAVYSISQVGTNAVMGMTVSVNGTDESVSTAEDWLLPSSHQQFGPTQTYTVTFTIEDKLEESVMTARLDTSGFIMHFNAAGTSFAIGHAVQETPTQGSGYTGTFEVDANMEVWIGHMTLKQYIQAVINGTV